MENTFIFSEIGDEISIDLLEQVWDRHYSKNPFKIGHNTSCILEPHFDTNDVKNMIDTSVKILNENGLKVSEQKKLNIELHNYYTNGPTVESDFERHCDDDAPIDVPCVTIIYYLEKSPTLIGGNLLVYPNKNDDNETICEVKTGTMIMLHGTTDHEIEPIEGTGSRRCIVIQVSRA